MTKPPGRAWVVTVPIRTVSESNAREFWPVRNKRVKEQRQTTVAYLFRAIGGGGSVRLPVEVKLVREGPRRLDSDNSVGSLKHVRDAIADWLGVDDGDELPGVGKVFWDYDQQKRPKTYSVRIEIREMS